LAYAIIVNRSDKQLTLYHNGVLKKSYPVGVGKMLTPSPPGTYYVATKRPNPGGPFGAMWMGLSIPHYGIHGTNNPSSIGYFVSHGCIRMYNQDVLELSHLVPIGTPVTII
jgi:lipoprotein-anchoring transpeptidase ErfK/SrfK